MLLPVSRDDNGATVECILEHSTIDEPITSSLNLEIYFPPRVELTTSSPAPLPEGASVTLSCDVTSNPPAKISWRRIGSGESILVGSSPNLVLNPVRREDDGSYQCSAENELGLSKPETVLVQVHCKFLSNPSSIHLSNCQTFYLFCTPLSIHSSIYSLQLSIICPSICVFISWFIFSSDHTCPSLQSFPSVTLLTTLVL